MSDEGEESATRMRARHDEDRRKHPSIINELKDELTPYGVQLILDAHEKSIPMVAQLQDEEGTYKVGMPGDVGFFTVSLTSCSGACEINRGLPCAHMLKVYAATNTPSLALTSLHPFWLRKKKTIEGLPAGVAEAELDSVGVGDEVGVGREQGKGKGVQRGGDGDKGEEGARLALVKKTERYLNVMEAAKPLAALAQASIHSYREVMQGLDSLHHSLVKSLSKPPQGGASATATGEGQGQWPLNPRTVPSTGRAATKRKRSAYEQRRA